MLWEKKSLYSPGNNPLKDILKFQVERSHIFCSARRRVCMTLAKPRRGHSSRPREIPARCQNDSKFSGVIGLACRISKGLGIDLSGFWFQGCLSLPDSTVSSSIEYVSRAPLPKFLFLYLLSFPRPFFSLTTLEYRMVHLCLFARL